MKLLNCFSDHNDCIWFRMNVYICIYIHPYFNWLMSFLHISYWYYILIKFHKAFFIRWVIHLNSILSVIIIVYFPFVRINAVLLSIMILYFYFESHLMLSPIKNLRYISHSIFQWIKATSFYMNSCLNYGFTKSDVHIQQWN